MFWRSFKEFLKETFNNFEISLSKLLKKILCNFKFYKNFETGMFWSFEEFLKETLNNFRIFCFFCLPFLDLCLVPLVSKFLLSKNALVCSIEPLKKIVRSGVFFLVRYPGVHLFLRIFHATSTICCQAISTQLCRISNTICRSVFGCFR